MRYNLAGLMNDTAASYKTMTNAEGIVCLNSNTGSYDEKQSNYVKVVD